MRARRGFTIHRRSPEDRLQLSVAAAIVAGAVVGGVATSVAGDKAASAQASAARTAANTELEMYNQNRADLAPYRQAALNPLSTLSTGLEAGGDFNRDFTIADFQKDPGYQFRMDEGQRALERSAASRGGLLNGGTLRAIQRYGQDYSSGEYSNAYARFNNDRTQRFNRLSALAGTGQTATNTTAALGTNAANNIAESQLQAGNARAAQAINQGNAVNDVTSSLGQFYLQQQYKNSGAAAGGGRSVGGMVP